MTLVVLGATSGTGRELVARAVAHGQDVVAAARRPEALTPGAGESAPRVVRADVMDRASLPAALGGAGVVVSVVGISGLLAAREPAGLYSVGTSNLVAAMGVAGVRRLVVVSSSGVEESPADGWFYRQVLTRFFLAPLYEDMREMERLVRGSDLDWTIVRPPRLTDGPLTAGYRISVGSNLPDDRSLSRADLAHFLFAEALQGAHRRQVVALSD